MVLPRCSWGWLAVTLMLLATSAAHAQETKKPEPRLDAYGDPLPEGALARLGSTRLRAGGSIGAAAVSSDGKLIAYTSDRMDVIFAELATGKIVRTIKAGFIGSEAMAFAPDGKALAVVGGNNALQLLDADNGKALWTVKAPPPHRFTSLAFAAEGTVLAAGGESFGKAGVVVLVDPASGKELAQLEILQNYGTKVAVSGDGKFVASWGNYIPRGAEKMPDAPATVQIWDVAAAKELKRIKLDQGQVAAAALSADGKLLAAVNGGATLRLYDVDSGKEVRRMAGRRGMGAFVRFSPDGATVAAGTYDGFVQLWQTASGKRQGSFQAPRLRNLALVFPPKGPALAWGVDGQAVRVWEVPGGQALAPTTGHTHRVAALAFVNKGKGLVSAGLDGRLCWWDPSTGKEVKAIRVQDDEAQRYGAGGAFSALAMSADAHYLIGATSYAQGARLWDLKDNQVICDLDGARLDVQLLTFAPDGATVAAAFRDRAAHFWDVNTGQELAAVKIPDGDFRSLAFAPDGKSAALSYSYFDRNKPQQMSVTQIVKSATGEVVKEWKRPGVMQSALAISNDGTTLAISGQGQTLLLLDIASGHEIAKLGGGGGQLTALTFSPDGRTLAAAGHEYGTAPKIHIYELATRSLRCSFTGHTGTVDRLVFSPDGRRLASGGSDTTVLLWDLAGQLLRDQHPPAADDKALQGWWIDLSAADGRQAYTAMIHLTATPKQTLALLKEQLKPAPAVKADAELIAKLIRDLDDEKFTVRDKAQGELAKIGTAAAEPLRKALAADPSPEKRKRLESLLAKIETRELSPRELQEMRAVEVLEFIAGEDARQLLTRLAEGAAGAVLTENARAVLKRLP